MRWGAARFLPFPTSNSYRLAPHLRHQSVSGLSRVDTVSGPVGGFGSGFDGFIELCLKGDPDRAGSFGDFLGKSAPCLELGKPRVIDCASSQDEGLADDERDSG
jgi:hypothetical protein